MIRALSFAALLAATAAPALAQNSAPYPLPYTDTIPQPRDIAYPGTMTVDVDATNNQQGIFKVKQTIPVAKAGPMVLLFPKWIPGKHGPRGEIEKVAGLQFRANGQVIPWKRDELDVFAFHVTVPKGAKTLEASFDFVSATKSDQGRIVMAPNMLNLQWYSLSLYPAGYYTRRIPVKATATYPAGWSAASAIPAKVRGSTYSYDTVDYEVLVDSPVFAGRYYRDINLGARVDLNVFADSPEELEATPEQIDKHRNLVTQAIKLFGAEHSCSRSARRWAGSASSIIAARRMASGSAISRSGTRAIPAATCCRTNMRIAGSANIAAATTRSPPTSASRCAIRCCGPMKGMTSSSVMC
jgi:predicted metalloprotease with PDZ domain